MASSVLHMHPADQEAREQEVSSAPVESPKSVRTSLRRIRARLGAAQEQVRAMRASRPPSQPKAFPPANIAKMSPGIQRASRASPSGSYHLSPAPSATGSMTPPKSPARIHNPIAVVNRALNTPPPPSLVSLEADSDSGVSDEGHAEDRPRLPTNRRLSALLSHDSADGLVRGFSHLTSPTSEEIDTDLFLDSVELNLSTSLHTPLAAATLRQGRYAPAKGEYPSSGDPTLVVHSSTASDCSSTGDDKVPELPSRSPRHDVTGAIEEEEGPLGGQEMVTPDLSLEVDVLMPLDSKGEFEMASPPSVLSTSNKKKAKVNRSKSRGRPPSRSQSLISRQLPPTPEPLKSAAAVAAAASFAGSSSRRSSMSDHSVAAAAQLIRNHADHRRSQMNLQSVASLQSRESIASGVDDSALVAVGAMSSSTMAHMLQQSRVASESLMQKSLSLSSEHDVHHSSVFDGAASGTSAANAAAVANAATPRFSLAHPNARRLSSIERQKSSSPVFNCDSSSRGSMDHAEVSWSTALEYAHRGEFEEAAAWGEDALRYQIEEGSDPIELANMQNGLSMLYRNIGRYEEAFHLCLAAHRFLEQDSRLPPPELVASTANNLGLLQIHRKNFEDAEHLLLWALRLREMMGSPSKVAQSLMNLVALYVRRRSFSDAEPLTRRLVRLRQRQYGPEHEKTAVALNELGLCLDKLSRFHEAEALYREAFAIHSRVHDADNTAGTHQMAACIENLAHLCVRQNKQSEAETLTHQLLGNVVARFGPIHTEVARILRNLALIYHRQGKLPEALNMYECAVRVIERLNKTGSYSVSFVMMLSNLTDVFLRLGRPLDAEQSRERIHATLIAADWPYDTKRRVAEVIIRNASQGVKEFVGTEKERRSMEVAVAKSRSIKGLQDMAFGSPLASPCMAGPSSAGIAVGAPVAPAVASRESIASEDSRDRTPKTELYHAHKKEPVLPSYYRTSLSTNVRSPVRAVAQRPLQRETIERSVNPLGNTPNDSGTTGQATPSRAAAAGTPSSLNDSQGPRKRDIGRVFSEPLYSLMRWRGRRTASMSQIDREKAGEVELPYDERSGSGHTSPERPTQQRHQQQSRAQQQRLQIVNSNEADLSILSDKSDEPVLVTRLASSTAEEETDEEGDESDCEGERDDFARDHDEEDDQAALWATMAAEAEGDEEEEEEEEEEESSSWLHTNGEERRESIKSWAEEFVVAAMDSF